MVKSETTHSVSDFMLGIVQITLYQIKEEIGIFYLNKRFKPMVASVLFIFFFHPRVKYSSTTLLWNLLYFL